MNKKDLPVFMGIKIFSIGLISTLYGIITVIIMVFFGYTGIIVYVKDVFFDLVFLLLGLLLIRSKKKVNFRKNHIKR